MEIKFKKKVWGKKKNSKQKPFTIETCTDQK